MIFIADRTVAAKMFAWAVLTALLFSRGYAQDCQYQYGMEPAPARSNDCSLLNQTVQIKCQVTPQDINENVLLQWFRSTDVSDAGRTDLGGSFQIDNEDEGYRVRSGNLLKSDGSPSNVAASRLIINLDSSHFGYYWCAVKAGEDFLQTSSRVLHIDKLCRGSAPCTELDLFNSSNTGHCAELAANVSIVPAQTCDTIPNTDTTTSPGTTAKPTNTTSSPDTSPESTEQDKTTRSTSRPPSPQETPTATAAAPPETPTATTPAPPETPTATAAAPPEPMSVVWLSVGISVAVMLAAITSIIALIMCLQFKRARAKGPVSIPQQSSTQADTINGRYVGNPELRLDAMLEQDHDYAEIPAHFREKGSCRNPSFGQQHSPPLPFANKTRGYTLPSQQNGNTGIEMQPVPGTHNYKLVTSGETEEYSHLQHSGSVKSHTLPVNKSLTASRLPLPHPPTSPQAPPLKQDQDPLLDDPNYISSIQLPTKPSGGVHRSAGGEDNAHGTQVLSQDGAPEDYYEKPVDFVGRKELMRIEADQKPRLDSKRSPEQQHSYTPIDMKKQPRPNNYSHAIKSLEDSYVSERGHVYQVLETSLKSNEQGNNSTKEDTNVPVGMDQPVYHVLETSPTKFESDGPVYHVLEVSQSPLKQPEDTRVYHVLENNA